jgi:hypothetical protein
MKNYIFGYGSLVNEQSRNITGESTFVGEARVRGLQRGWNVQVAAATALGITKISNAICNGIIISVSDQGLERYDIREISTKYERIELSKSDVELSSGDISDGILWAYIAIDPKEPDEKHPILQSYVDVVLAGFFDFGVDYAKEFAISTKGWVYPVNDRNNPKYPRALDKLEYKVEIDALVSSLGLIPE